jgi:hypothetical protein
MVRGSTPGEVIGFFNWPNHSSRTVALELTQPLTEMSTRNLSGGKGRPAHNIDNLAAIWTDFVEKMWEPRRLTTLRASVSCYRDSVTFHILRKNTYQSLIGSLKRSGCAELPGQIPGWQALPTENPHLFAVLVERHGELYPPTTRKCQESKNSGDCDKIYSVPRNTILHVGLCDNEIRRSKFS